MKIVGKRLLCIILTIAMIGFSLQSFEVDAYAAEQEVQGICQSLEDSQRQEVPEEPDINKEEAKDIAEFQVDETLKNQEIEWGEGTKIRKVYNLYNEKEEICAYAVELENGTKDAGYVVVGAVEENPPIIEFRTSGRFLDERLQSDEHLLYDGGINYYKVDEDTNEATNIETKKESFSLDDVVSVQEVFEQSRTEEIKSEWDAVRKSARLGSSTPPTKGTEYVTNPSIYESGYTSVTSKIAPDATSFTYFVTTDFGPGGICVPTAACNLLRYYVGRKRMKKPLLINNDWQLTFNKIKEYFKTNKYGTFMTDVKPGLDKYFKYIGIQDAVTHYYGYDDDYEGRPDNDRADWNKMKERIDFGDPFLYGVNSHYLYKNHTVLALGYTEYNYAGTQASGFKTSRYLRTADGHSKHSDRYINVQVGHDTTADEMVTLFFKYSFIQK